MSGPGMDGGARVALDRQDVDALLGEEQRRRQSDEAAADDKHGNLARDFAVSHSTNDQAADDICQAGDVNEMY
jgi:hypothetical protein